MPNLEFFLRHFVSLADIAPLPPPSPHIPGTENDLPSAAFVAVTGAFITFAVLAAAGVAFKTGKQQAARIGFGFFGAAILLTIAAVCYTSAQHAAHAEEAEEIRRSYSPPEQPDDWPRQALDDPPGTSAPDEGFGAEGRSPE